MQLVVDRSHEFVQLYLAAKILGLHNAPEMITMLIRKGEHAIKIHKFGDRALFVRRDDLEAFIAQQRPGRQVDIVGFAEKLKADRRKSRAAKKLAA